tara:strand:+ start:110 stop:325 length:216 start_codon:yes stop_codon:yes gene_type:complete
MKVGDLVKVSNKGFTAIGYIKEKTGHVYYTVRYLATLEDHGKHTNRTGGIWSEQYMTLLKEVKYEEETGKT